MQNHKYIFQARSRRRAVLHLVLSGKLLSRLLGLRDHVDLLLDGNVVLFLPLPRTGPLLDMNSQQVEKAKHQETTLRFSDS